MSLCKINIPKKTSYSSFLGKLIAFLFLFGASFHSHSSEKPAFKPSVKAASKEDTKSAFLSFDIPIAYNSEVKRWVKHFQGPGKKWFQKWLDRSSTVLPVIHLALEHQNLPLDLAYLAMIESGLSATAVSSAKAVGYWQFIKPTALAYGLTVNSWVDERRNLQKSTYAAVSYLSDLYKRFGTWYLTASAYNMGEGRLSGLIKRHESTNFWYLSSKSNFPKETKEYIPKLIATALIAKAPKLYGFHPPVKNPIQKKVLYFHAPGGTSITELAKYLGLSSNEIKALNPELLLDIIPTHVKNYKLKIPHLDKSQVALYLDLVK